MKREEAKAKFVRGAEEMWEWGEEHPQASFDEIAGKLALLRRELMGDDAGGVAVATWRWEVRGGRLSRVWAGDFSPWTADFSC